MDWNINRRQNQGNSEGGAWDFSSLAAAAKSAPQRTSSEMGRLCTQLCLPTSRGTHDHREPGSRGSRAHALHTLFFQLQRCPQRWPPIPSSGHSAHKPNDPGGSGGTCGPSLHFSYVHRSNGAHDPGGAWHGRGTCHSGAPIVAPVTAARHQQLQKHTELWRRYQQHLQQRQ